MYIAYPRIARTFALTKKEKMEKRIKTVWILTIITAILIIGGQGYWLHHQYCYSTKTFMQELHKQILQLEKEEMNTRYDKRTNNHKYTLSYKIEMPDSVNQNGKTTCIISFYRQQSEIDNLDSLIKQNALLNEDSVIVRDSFRVENISNEILFDAATRYGAEMTHPFQAGKFDSLLQANQIKLTNIRLIQTDSILWHGSYTSSTRLFKPEMYIAYPYNPLLKQALTASIQIPFPSSNDLERVTKQAYAMVVYFGMSDKLPNLNYYDSTGQDWGFTKPYSEETAKLIDTEVQKIINEQYDRAKRILSENKEGHSKLAQVLLDREVIYSEDVEHIFGKRAWISRSQEILELQEKANGKNKENADKEAEADATTENVTDTPTEENKTGKIA